MIRMLELAAEMNRHLPIRRSVGEEEYITFLWRSFGRLADKESPETQAYSLTAFHLLFMLAVQYKVLRLAKERRSLYQCSFTLSPLRPEQEKVLLSPTEVFGLAQISEKTIFHLFDIVGLPKECRNRCKKIIDQRNNVLMHATGQITADPEEYVQNCVERIAEIQACFLMLNDEIASRWEAELESSDDEDGRFSFLEARLYESLLTPADFNSGALATLFQRTIEEHF
jgi:hypothetical protein